MRHSLKLVIAAALLASLHTACHYTQKKNMDTALSESQVLAQREDRLFVRLPNGLIVMAQRSGTAPVVSVQCFVKTGSIYEQEYNGLGLSHFLEHLIAGGSTTHRTEVQANAILGQIGGQTNAATSLDNVFYYINTSSDHAPTAIDLLSDWLQHSQIRDVEFNRERDVILREFAMGRGEPSRIFWKLTQQARFSPVHPARHPTIGYEDEFVTVTRDQVYDFYKRMYVPNNMVFVVTGDIDPVATVKQITSLWAESKPGELPTVYIPKEPPVDQPRTVSGTANVDRPRLRLTWVGASMATKEDYALDLLGRILGDGELSRLVRTVRDEKGLVTTVDASNWSFNWGDGLFGVDAMPEKGKTQEAQAAILQVVSELVDKGVTAEELSRAKSKTIAEAVYSAQTAEDTAQRLARDFISTGDPDYLDYYTKAIGKVTAEDIRQAAKKFLQPGKLITVELMPNDGPAEVDKRPAESPRGVKVAKGPESIELKLDNSSLIAKMRSMSGHTAAQPEISKLQMKTLPNGLRVVIQKNTRLPLVAMQWYELGGLLGETPGKEGMANASTAMLMKGAGDLSADQIAERLEKIGAQMGAGAGNSTIFVSAQSLSKDWKDVLGLMSQVILKPTFPTEEWERMKPRILAEIDSTNDTWYGELRASFRKAYFGDHPWAQTSAGRREVIEAVTAQQLQKYHAGHLSAKDSVLVIVGDVDEKQVLAVVEKLFGAMPLSAPVPFQAVQYTPGPSGYTLVKSAKPTPAVVIGYGPGLDRKDRDYAAMMVLNSVLSSFPVGWLDRALRGEGQGLVYAVGAGVSTGPIRGYWSVLFNTQNPTLTPALEAALQVVDRIRAQIVDDATLARARQAVLVDEAFGRQAAGQLASAAAIDELYGLSYDHAQKDIENIRRVTAADVNRVANQYLKNPIAVVISNQDQDVKALPPLK